MRSFSKKNKIFFIIIIGLFIVFSLNFFQKEVREFFYLISSPIQKTFWQTGLKISNFFEMIAEVKNLKTENQELKLKVQKLLAENKSLRELRKENQNLRRALELGLEKDFKLNWAEVVAKDINEDILLIDQGWKDGIAFNQPVITAEKVLLGRISEVYENFSKVILISNKKSSFDAKISERGISGLVNGKGGGKVSLDLIPQNQEISKGDLLITTSLGGIYPSGLLVGLVAKAEKSDVKPFQEITVSPFFNLTDLENVFIIINQISFKEKD